MTTAASVRPARILMVGASAPSHIRPGLPLVAELVARGHLVDYAVAADFADLIAPTGAHHLPHPTLLPAGDWPEDVMAAMRIFLEEGIAVAAHLEAHLAAAPPDLVLYDIGGLAGPVLAHRAAVPAVQLSPAHVAWEGYERDMAEFLDPLWASPGGRDYAARCTGWLRANGITRPFREVIGTAARCIALIPRVLQPNAERVDASVAFVGPLVDPARLAEPLPALPAGDAPLVYMALGTAYTDRPDLYRTVAAGIARAGMRGLIAVGDRVDPATLGAAPAGVGVVRSAPQVRVLAQAAAFVTHAGMGSCGEALWAGVPTLALPQAVDQFANAAMLEQVGVGRVLPEEGLTPAAVAMALTGLLSDHTVARRCADLSAQVRTEAGPRRAADAVEAHLG